MTSHAKRRDYIIDRLRDYEGHLGFQPLSPRRLLYQALIAAAYDAGAGVLKHSQVRRWVEQRAAEIERPLIRFRWPKAGRIPIESRHMFAAVGLAQALRAVGVNVEGIDALNVISEWLLRAEAGGLREIMLEAALGSAEK